MQYNRKLIGQRLKQYRLDLGFDQKVVAEACNINQSMLSQFENKGLGGLDIMVDLLNFYSQSFNVSNLLQPHFTLLYKDSADDTLAGYKGKVAFKFEEFEINLKNQMAHLRLAIHGNNVDI